MPPRTAAPSPPSAPSRAGEPRRAATVWLSLALLVITTLVYLPAGRYDFVNYDDPQFVRENPRLQAGLNLDTVRWACSAVQVANWHPVTTLSYLLDYQLFGLNPGASHLVNVGFHALNTLLLFWVLASFTGETWPSAWVAALFALHPLHVESVAWIAERKDVLSTFFGLLTLWAYLAYVRRPTAWRYTAILGAYVLALLSKTMVVTLPFVLLLLDVWPLRRWGTWNSTAEQQRRNPVSLVVEKVPLFLLAALFSVVTYVVQARSGAVTPLESSPLSVRVANAALSYATYLVKMVWPAGLAVFYPPDQAVPAWQVLGATTVLISVTGGVLWGARRYPYLLTGWLWYLGMLVPVIGLVQQGAQARADRFTYMPLVGIFIMAAWGVPDLLRRWRHGRTAGAALAVASVAAAAVLSVRQLSFWRDSVTLFEHALAVTENNLLAQSLIGTLDMDGGRRQAALEHLSEAARICDTSRGEATVCATAHYNTGFLLAARGDLDGAQQHYRAALRFNPSYAKAYLGLGKILGARGDLGGAAAAYRDALRLEPTEASAHTNLAITLENLGQTDEAVVHYTEAVHLTPQDAAARCNLAGALASAGRLHDSIEQFRAAVRLQPQLVEARFGLATAYAQAGQTGAAIATLDELLPEQLGNSAVETALAWLLATADDPQLRNGARAVRLAEAAASRTDHHDADVLNSLAAAYAEVGRFDTAVQTAEAALALARANNRAPLAEAVTERLVLYRAGQPVRDHTGGAP